MVACVAGKSPLAFLLLRNTFRGRVVLPSDFQWLKYWHVGASEVGSLTFAGIVLYLAIIALRLSGSEHLNVAPGSALQRRGVCICTVHVAWLRVAQPVSGQA